ncbi:hypothetical protein PT974_06422 [Cladobotryum mycophilum]|uniref:Uncharacterized protein n=1 Tax=Cladobotryum mycophilum TaxID=491253 RepID=A0ABR0SLI2_9HYPO
MDQITSAGCPGNDYVFIEVHNTGSTSEESPYQNYIHQGGEAMLCMNNYAERDDLFGTSARIVWSDLMAVCYSRVVGRHGGDMKGLKTIWRVYISNLITQGVIDAILKGRKTVIDVGAGEPGFFALLGTVHGNGPAYMLGDYPEMFRRKFISRARIVPYGDIPALCWILEEIPLSPPPPPPAPLDDRPKSRKERRQHRKAQSRSSAASIQKT